MISPNGNLTRCPDCYDLWRFSGLLKEEQEQSVADLKDFKTKNGTLLRAVITQMLAEPYGFLTFWGNPGSAKTMALQLIVIEMVKRQIQAKYTTAKAIEKRIFAQLNKKETVSLIEFSPERMPVLAVDELNDANYANSFVRGELLALFDQRFRSARAGTSITIFATQYDPSGLDKEADVEAAIPEMLYSRLADAEFAKPWVPELGDPKDFGVNAYYRHEQWKIPPIIYCDQPDARPYLRKLRTGDIDKLRR